MGRKKITIQQIKDDRNRHVTFNKRKSGLIKKAMELSILCNCQISLVIFNAENQLFEYCSTDPRMILQRYCQVAHTPHERLTNNDYAKYDRGSKKAGGKKKDDDDDDGGGDEVTNMGTSDASGIDAQLSQLVPAAGAAGMIQFPSVAPPNSKQPAPQFAAASFPTPNTMTPMLISPPNYNNEMLPLTPRTETQIAHIMAQAQGGIMSQSQQTAVAGLLANSAARQRFGQMNMQEDDNSNKRKQPPSDDEEEQPVAPAPKKRKMDPLTIQVPKQTAPVQMQRLDQVVNAFVPPQNQFKPVQMAPNPTPQLDTPNLTSLLSPTADNSPLPTPTALIKNDIDGYAWPEAQTPKK